MADFTALKTAIQTYIKQNGNEEITGEKLQEILLSMVTTLGDSAINNLVTALNDEVAARQNADGTLQQNITNEATARGNADTALSNRLGSTITAENTAAAQIAAEATARESADTALGNLISGITSNIENGYVYAGIATPSSTPATGKVFYLALTAGTYTNFGSTVVSQGINILKYNGSAWSLDAFIGIDDVPTPSSTGIPKSGGTFDFVMKNGSAFDISAHFASGGTLATYADLSAALAALDTLPAAYKRGGMVIRYVDSSDNKYVQWRLMSDSFSTAVSDWQGIDGEPTANSENLVKSGGVAEFIIDKVSQVNLIGANDIKEGYFPSDASSNNIFVDLNACYSSSVVMVSTAPIEVIGGKKLYLSLFNSSLASLVEYGADGAFIKSTPTSASTTGQVDGYNVFDSYITLDARTKFIILSTYSHDGAYVGYFTASYNTITERGIEDINFVKVINDKSERDTSQLHNEVDDISSEIVKCNILSQSNIKDGYYPTDSAVSILYNEDAVYSPHVNIVSSKPISVKGGETFYFVLGYSSLAYIREYGVTGTLIKTTSSIKTTYIDGYEIWYGSVTLDANTRYIIVSSHRLNGAYANYITLSLAPIIKLGLAYSSKYSTPNNIISQDFLFREMSIVPVGSTNIPYAIDKDNVLKVTIDAPAVISGLPNWVQISSGKKLDAGTYLFLIPSNLTHIRITEHTTSINVILEKGASVNAEYVAELDKHANANTDILNKTNPYKRILPYDNAYMSLGRLLASRNLATQLSTPVLDTKLGEADTLYNTAGKMLLFNNYIYILKGQNDGTSAIECQYQYLVKFDPSDNCETHIKLFDVNSPIEIDGQEYAVLDYVEGNFIVVNNKIVAFAWAHIDTTHDCLVAKIVTDSLVVESTNICNITYNGTTMAFNNTNLANTPLGANVINGTRMLNAGMSNYDGYYYGAALCTYSAILRTNDGINWEIAHMLHGDVSNNYFGEFGIDINTDGIVHLAKRIGYGNINDFQNEVRKYDISDWSLIDNTFIAGGPSMCTFFRDSNNTLYLLSPGDDYTHSPSVSDEGRKTYKISYIDEKHLDGCRTLLDTNGIVFGPNTNVVQFGGYLYGCLTGKNLKVVKFKIEMFDVTKTNQVLDQILA
jgi:hypothetical protein